MSYHRNQLVLPSKTHRKQITGTPISKSCEPLIAEDDYVASVSQLEYARFYFLASFGINIGINSI